MPSDGESFPLVKGGGRERGEREREEKRRDRKYRGATEEVLEGTEERQQVGKVLERGRGREKAGESE